MSQYISVLPQAQKAYYTANDVVDFRITSTGCDLVASSFRLNGTLKVSNGGGVLDAGDRCFYDHFCGVHSLFTQISTQTDMLGEIEGIVNYPRLVRMWREQNVDETQLASESRFVSEGCAQSDMSTVYTLTATGAGGLPFSAKPLICLNSTNGNIPTSKTGAITVSVRLAQVLEAFFSQSVAGLPAGTSYQITDFTMTFQTLPQAPKPGQVVMRIYKSLQQYMDSDVSSFRSVVPVVATCVSASFLTIAHMNSGQFNNYATEVPSGSVSRVEVSINDQVSGGLLTYPLTSQGEILSQYKQSLSGASVFDSLSREERTNPRPQSDIAVLVAVPQPQCYGVGFNFETPIDFSQSAFGLQLTSGVAANGTPMFIYLYFAGLKVF